MEEMRGRDELAAVGRVGAAATVVVVGAEARSRERGRHREKQEGDGGSQRDEGMNRDSKDSCLVPDSSPCFRVYLCIRLLLHLPIHPLLFSSASKDLHTLNGSVDSLYAVHR